MLDNSQILTTPVISVLETLDNKLDAAFYSSNIPKIDEYGNTLEGNIASCRHIFNHDDGDRSELNLAWLFALDANGNYRAHRNVWNYSDGIGCSPALWELVVQRMHRATRRLKLSNYVYRRYQFSYICYYPDSVTKGLHAHHEHQLNPFYPDAPGIWTKATFDYPLNIGMLKPGEHGKEHSRRAVERSSCS